MLQTLKDLFDALTPGTPSDPPETREHSLRLATAVLLVEVMRSDTDMADSERQAVLSALRSEFSLAEDELDRLVELAEQRARDSHDFHSFTSRVNESFEHEQKVRIVELMWRVAYADGQLTAHENHVMRRIADLLHLPHGAYVNAKMRAKAAERP